MSVFPLLLPLLRTPATTAATHATGRPVTNIAKARGADESTNDASDRATAAAPPTFTADGSKSLEGLTQTQTHKHKHTTNYAQLYTTLITKQPGRPTLTRHCRTAIGSWRSSIAIGRASRRKHTAITACVKTKPVRLRTCLFILLVVVVFVVVIVLVIVLVLMCFVCLPTPGFIWRL